MTLTYVLSGAGGACVMAFALWLLRRSDNDE